MTCEKAKNNKVATAQCVCKHIGEEMIEGRLKKGKCVFFSREQEVHVSESGSAETALE